MRVPVARLVHVAPGPASPGSAYQPGTYTWGGGEQGRGTALALAHLQGWGELPATIGQCIESDGLYLTCRPTVRADDDADNKLRGGALAATVLVQQDP